MDAPQLAALLASDAADDRARAYAALEATDDVALAAASVAPLTAVFARPVEEIDASELQRGWLALGHLVSLDGVAVGGEYVKEGRWLTAWSSEGNALNTALAKPVAELTRADALLCAAEMFAFCPMQSRGMDPLFAVAGISTMDFLGSFVGASPYGPVKGTDERNNRLSTLIADALREERGQMADGLVAGAFTLLNQLSAARPATALHQIEIGVLGLAVAELRTMPSSDWMSVIRCPSVRAAGAMAVFGSIFNSHPDPGTPGLLEVGLEALEAYRLAGVSEDTNIFCVMMVCVILYSGRLSAFSEENAAAIRAAAPSIRFVMDHPQDLMAEIGMSTGMIAGVLAAEVFGRDEGDTMQLSQTDVDDIIKIMNSHVAGELMGGAFPLTTFWCEALRDICVSDLHKNLVLANPDAIPHLLSGLFLDPDHPRGLRANEILGPQAAPTPVEVQAVWQQNYAEALAQLALFPAGKDALLTDESVTAALEAVVEHGLSQEAKEFARGALIGLRGFAEHEVVVANHVMLSYEWEMQPTILRINDSLSRRGYAVWVDVEQMKGSIMDAMSDAVEGAEVILYGVSKRYKESANCRLEANYAHQQDVDMIPLMMQKGYKANGWLGLILGTRLYYSFHDAASDDDAAFEKRMDSVVREIGGRGKHQLPESVPPARAPAAAPRRLAPVRAPAPAPTPAPAPKPVPARAPAPAPTPSPEPAPALAPAPTVRAPSTPALAVAPAADRSYSPTMYGTEQHGEAGAGASLVDLSAFVDLAEKMQTRTEDKIERLREEMKAEKEEMRAEMKAEAKAEKEELRRELAPTAVVTDEQLAALEARLEALHAAQLISDDELFAVEDCVADFFEAKAAFEVVTTEVAGTNRAVGKVHKLVVLSEGVAKDAVLARQLRRKFV